MKSSQKTTLAYAALVIVFAVLVVLALTLPSHARKNTLASNAQNSLPAAQSTNEALPVNGRLKTSNGSVIDVRIAATDAERELGLSYFSSLPQNEGMFFVFNQSGVYPFWMKGMNFPLDIIWMKAVAPNTYQVVYDASDVTPGTYPETISPSQNADAVLEINALQSQAFGIVNGSEVTLSIK